MDNKQLRKENQWVFILFIYLFLDMKQQRCHGRFISVGLLRLFPFVTQLPVMEAISFCRRFQKLKWTVMAVCVQCSVCV